MKRLGLIILFGLSLLLIIISSSQANITGPHNITNSRGVCANCHIPHHAKGAKIWARVLQNFGGVRQLCNSCHDGTFSQGGINPNDPNSPEIESGIKTVFGEEFESHVMHGAADISQDDWLGNYDEVLFPLDPNDEDVVQGHPVDWDRGGSGFYCGSCHNPHLQPEGIEDGDYLRSNNEDVGEPGNRSPFCKKCHNPYETNNSHLSSDNCQACHHPHKGYEKARTGMGDDELRIARLILRVKLDEKFIAKPNVPGLSEDPNERTFIYSSYFCYGCHQARHVLDPSDPNLNFWRENGAAPIYGDQVNDTSNNKQRKNHHPMGTQAILTGGKFERAPGGEAAKNLNNNDEITCISCHKDFHGAIPGKNYNQSKENNFLRWDFADDNAVFCIQCHSDKTMEIDKKHFLDTNSTVQRKVYDPNDPDDYEKEVPCRQCMFCHFIHDGNERDNEGAPGSIRADIDALMRVDPNNLAWGDRTNDTDSEDYEDMCYGCHSNESIVGGTRGECNDGAGSLLRWSNNTHTHRFASAPDPNNPPAAVIKYGETFPLSDGEGVDTKNDYGTKKDSIFCGTCHNVHDKTVSPYLNYDDSPKSPYEPDGFCEECHDAESSQFNFVHNSHPIERGPAFPRTAETWPKLFYSGGGGCEDGIALAESDYGTTNGSSDGNILCLTCHNVHAAATSHEGTLKIGDSDKTHGFLLVKDNMLMEVPGGSDMCQGCHPFE
ncbi:MAG: hypothetical protein ACMUIU_07060 [bacterium]